MGPPGVILGGGRSRRFGQDKASTPWRGLPLALHVAQALREAGLRPVCLVGGQELPGLPLLADRYPGEGPLGGILTALEAFPAGALVAPCDTPRLPVALLKLLLLRAAEAEVVLPLVRGVPQPLCAWYAGGAREPLLQAYQGGERGVRRSLARLRVLELAADAWAEELADVDTPEAFRALGD